MNPSTYIPGLRSIFVDIIAFERTLVGILAGWDADLLHINGQALAVGSRVRLIVPTASGRITVAGTVCRSDARERAMIVQACPG
jgi:hypothetical protein